MGVALLATAVAVVGFAASAGTAPRLLSSRGISAQMFEKGKPIEPDDTWTTTASGLKYLDERVGSGEAAKEGDVVKVDYTGWLEASGREFDTSAGGKPIAFNVGKQRVIPGWDEGILSMRVGGRRRLSIPADLGYGDAGAGSIPPGASLQFETELVGIESGFGGIIATFPGGITNLALIGVLALSFIPYFLPAGIVPDAWLVNGGNPLE